MAYMVIIAKASQKFAWPSWVVYDQNFRQEAACSTSTQWARVDPSIYTQCFTGMAIGAEGWCKLCQSIEHSSENCPLAPKQMEHTIMSGLQAHSTREGGRHSQWGPLNTLRLQPRRTTASSTTDLMGIANLAQHVDGYEASIPKRANSPRRPSATGNEMAKPGVRGQGSAIWLAIRAAYFYSSS